jgi:hypothetical protein
LASFAQPHHLWPGTLCLRRRVGRRSQRSLRNSGRLELRVRDCSVRLCALIHFWKTGQSTLRQSRRAMGLSCERIERWTGRNPMISRSSQQGPRNFKHTYSSELARLAWIN